MYPETIYSADDVSGNMHEHILNVMIGMVIFLLMILAPDQMITILFCALILLFAWILGEILRMLWGMYRD